MKVTIDTKEDKIEDIHKVLQILTHILQNKTITDPSNPSSSTDTSNMMSMFGDDNSSPNQPDKAPDFSSFLNLTKNSSSTPAAKREEQPRIEYF